MDQLKRKKGTQLADSGLYSAKVFHSDTELYRAQLTPFICFKTTAPSLDLDCDWLRGGLR